MRQINEKTIYKLINILSFWCPTIPKAIHSFLSFFFRRGNVRRVVVCGHSDCKAINTLYDLYHGRPFDADSPMDHWLRVNGYQSVQKLAELERSEGGVELKFASENGLMEFGARIDPERRIGVEDRLSQINTLQQVVEFRIWHIEGISSLPSF